MADWKSCVIIFYIIATGTSCRLRSGNCPDGVTTDKESRPKPDPQKGLHSDVASTKQPEVNKRKKCCPYDFDSSLCQMVNDRILCGFNRNRGRLANNQEYRELSEGCRLRGGRVECGYVQAPYTNPRRPPPHDTADAEPDYNNQDDNNPGPVEPSREKVRLTLSRSPSTPAGSSVPEQPPNLFTKTPIKPKHMPTRCVEINDRIVCRHM